MTPRRRTPSARGQIAAVVTTQLSPERVRQLVAYLDRPEFVAPRLLEAEFWQALADCMVTPRWHMLAAIIGFWPTSSAEIQRAVMLDMLQPQLAERNAQKATDAAQREQARQRARRAHLRIVNPTDGAQHQPAADGPATEGGAR